MSPRCMHKGFYGRRCKSEATTAIVVIVLLLVAGGLFYVAILRWAP